MVSGKNSLIFRLFIWHDFNRSLWKNIFWWVSTRDPHLWSVHLHNWHFSLYLPDSFCAHFYQWALQLQPHFHGTQFPTLSTPDRHLGWSSPNKVALIMHPTNASSLGRFPLVLRNWSTISFPPQWFPPRLQWNYSKHNENANFSRCLYWGYYLTAWTRGY